MACAGRLAPVREESSSSVALRAKQSQGQRSAVLKPVTQDTADSTQAAHSIQEPAARSGPSNDHASLPTIKAACSQQQGTGRRSTSCSPEPGRRQQQLQVPTTAVQHHAASGSSVQQQQQLHQQLLAVQQHKAVASQAPASRSPRSVRPSVSNAGLQQSHLEQHMSSRHLLLGSTNSRRRSSMSSVSRPRTQQHQQQRQDDAADEEAFSTQEQLQQLYGHSSTCSPELEAAAGARILALPFAICTAADGALFEVATGHVQLMMLRRQLASLGVELTDEEAAMLTTAAVSSTGRPFALQRALRATQSGQHTGASSMTGAMPAGQTDDQALAERANGPAHQQQWQRQQVGRSFAGSLHSKGSHGGSRFGASAAGAGNSRLSMAGGGLRASCAGAAAGNAAVAAGMHARASMTGGMRASVAGGLPRRSALGAVLQAHAAADHPVNPQEQLPLDDLVLSHIAQLDLFVENLKQNLAQEAAAAKAAKASASVAAAAAASHRHVSARRSRSRHTTPRNLDGTGAGGDVQEGDAAGAQGGLSNHWGAARGLVMLNIQNWQQGRVRSARMQATPNKPPTWEDVILLGDVYIKRRSGQGAAVYEARCAELGVTPCTQVLQQLESAQANMAHCNIGAGSAPALAAALSANNMITTLDLRDNNLDGKAVSQILKGIATATAAHLTTRAKQRNISFAHQSVAAIGANRQAEGLPIARQTVVYEQQWPSRGPSAAPVSAGGGTRAARKSKSLAVRWGEWESDAGGTAGGSSGGAGAAAAAPGYSTTPATPVGRSAAGSLAVTARPWEEGGSGQDSAVFREEPLDMSAAAGFYGDSSSSRRSSSRVNSASAERGAASLRSSAGAAFFLPEPTEQLYSDGASFGSAKSSFAGGSFGGATGAAAAVAAISTAGADAHMALASLAGSSSGVWAGREARASAGERNSSAGHVQHQQQQGSRQVLEGDDTDAELQQDACPDAAAVTACDASSSGRHSCVTQQPRGSQGRGSAAAAAGGVDNCQRLIYSLLSELDLSENPLGLAGAKAVAQLLDPTVHPSQFLVTLKLSKCNLGEAGGLAVAAALRAGNLELRVLVLSHNNLGNKTAAAFGDLLESSHTLKELDLSWNQIKAEGAQSLAKGLAANATLSKLELAWNGLEEGACALGDMLAANMGLKHLDLSHCRIGSEACLMLGEGLKSNVMLEVLLLCGNDRIGEDGARHLMLALAANRSLQFLGLNGSNMTSAVRDRSGSSAEFNPASPDGSYSLDLAVAADRVVAVQLVELDRANEKELLRGITLEGKVIPSARKANWPSMLPSKGMLTCTFCSASVQKTLGVMESSKLGTLLKQLRLSTMSDRERLEIVVMFAPFALFTCKQISSIVRTFSIGAERVAAASLLFARAADSASDLVSLTSVMSGHDLLGWKDVLGWYSSYRWNVPTGHYELDLSLPVHAAIAARLKDESNSSPDGMTWINLLYDYASTCYKKPQSHGPPDDWKAAIPNRGSLSLDYVSTHPPGTKPPTSTWGLPPLSSSAASSAAGARGVSSVAGSAAGAAARGSMTSTTGATAKTGGAAPGSASASAAGGSGAAALGRASSVGAAGPAARASVVGADAVNAPKAVSDQQLEALMRDQLGLLPGGPGGPQPDTQSSSSSGGSNGSSSGGTAGVLTGVAAADAAIVALRQAIATGLLLVSSQVRQLVEAFTFSPHRVEAAVVCWPVTLDREDSYWTVLYSLQGIEQSNLLQRLGPARLFNPAHCSCHWFLDLSHPGHEEVAQKLVALASAPSGNSRDKNDDSSLPNWWNLRMRGVRKQVNENGNNMWGMLTAESFQPILEFDFLGADAWAALGKSEADVAALPAGDKLELRAKQAARLEAVRMRQLYPYSCDGSSYPRQPWATYQSLMSPQLIKSPWSAAWDRLVRVLLRLELRAGVIDRHTSSLQQAFEAAAVSEQMRAVRTVMPPGATAAAAAAPAGGVTAAAGADGAGQPSAAAQGQGEAAAAAGSDASQAVAAGAAGGVAAAAAASNAQAVVAGGATSGPAAARTSGSGNISSGMSGTRSSLTNGQEGEGQEEEEEQEEQLCITAQELEALLKSWGYNKTEVQHYLRLMEATLQAEAEQNTAAAADGAGSGGAAAAEPESTGEQSAAAQEGSSSVQLHMQQQGSNTVKPPSQGAVAAVVSGSRAAGGKTGGAAAGAAAKAGSKPESASAKGSSGTAAGKSSGSRGAAATAAAAAAAATAAAGGTSSDGQAAGPSFAAQLEARFDRGLTFNEFVAALMTEPARTVKLKDVLSLASLMSNSKSLLKGSKSKPAQPAAEA